MRYAGDVSPAEAYGMLKEDTQSVLVDVRTREELTYVGLPSLEEMEKPVLTIEWHPHLAAAELHAALAASGVEADDAVLFICRSGARSRNAAVLATGAGYTAAYNVADGFEGPLDDHGHRASVAGWKHAGLPWRQS